MKVTLTFEYEVKDSDGCGTHYDAMNCAVSDLQRALAWADSNDDVAEVFSQILYDGAEY